MIEKNVVRNLGRKCEMRVSLEKSELQQPCKYSFRQGETCITVGNTFACLLCLILSFNRIDTCECFVDI